MAKKERIKRPVAPVPRSLEETSEFVRQIGEKQRQISRREDEANEAIEKLKKAAANRIKVWEDEIELLRDGVYAYAESNRIELTKDGSFKTIDMPSGQIGWRLTPPSVSIRNWEEVLKNLKSMKLDRFIRLKEEADKEAMLREPKVAGAISGVKIGQREEFFIKPSETSLELVSATDKLKKSLG